jgi:hypothetical protein
MTIVVYKYLQFYSTKHTHRVILERMLYLIHEFTDSEASTFDWAVFLSGHQEFNIGPHRLFEDSNM